MNEQIAATAFSLQSEHFDAYDAGNTIIQYKRQRVRGRATDLLSPGSAILELNAGTGLDAMFFAREGHHVHATDIAEGMLKRLDVKTREQGLEDRITSELCSFTCLETLQSKGPYDMVFSNFAGLNCTGELDKVLAALPSLVKPGGHVVLVLLPGFCLWETLLAFKGKFRTAFRRWHGSKGSRAHVEGQYFTCWYYRPSYIVKRLRKSFRLLSVEGLCTIVPPSYIENFAETYPRVFRMMKAAEGRLKESWPWKYVGDYYIISLVRNETTDQG